MSVPSIERLARMVEEDGCVVIRDDGIWQRRVDGSPLQFMDAVGHKFSPPLPHAVFHAWRQGRLISQDISIPAGQGLVFAPTRNAWRLLARHRRQFRASRAAGTGA
jgi:hypothetical protein